MFPNEEMPFRQIRTTLDSIVSTHVRKVVLDLNVDKIASPTMDPFLMGVEGLDERLCRLAELSVTEIGLDIFTVVLSAPDPFISADYLSRIRQKGKVVLGTRYRGSNVCGDIFRFGEDREEKIA